MSLFYSRGMVVGGVLLAAWLGQRMYGYAQSKHGAGRHSLPADEAAVVQPLFPHYFPSRSTGLWLYTRQWLASSEPTGVVFIVHGFGEHSGRYEHIARAFNALGLHVYALDHQGHGNVSFVIHCQSEGDRAYVESVSDYVVDYIAFMQYIQATKYSSVLPCFLFAHSMGGLIGVQIMRATFQNVNRSSISSARLRNVYTSSNNDTSSSAASSSTPSATSSTSTSSTAASSTDPASSASSSSSTTTSSAPVNADLWPWTGAILSSPALEPGADARSPILLALGRFFSRYLPKLPLKPLNANAISRIPVVVEAYNRDPLNYHGKLLARWAGSMLETMGEVRAALSNITFPYLLIQGERDELCAASGAHAFVSQTASADRTLKAYHHAFHETFNDENHQEVMHDITQWIQHKLQLHAHQVLHRV